MRQSVIILDDHPLVARGVAKFIEAVQPHAQLQIAGTTADLRQLIAAQGAPSLVLADIWLDGSNLLEDLASFLSSFPQTAWLAMSGDDDPSIPARAQTAGAMGFVHKRAPPEILALAVQAVLRGQQWFQAAEHRAAPVRAQRDWLVTPAELGLTSRQGNILELVLRGLPNKRIAIMLDVAESTVKEHVTNILCKLGVRTRVEAITKLRGKRLLPTCTDAAANQTPHT